MEEFLSGKRMFLDREFLRDTGLCAKNAGLANSSARDIGMTPLAALKSGQKGLKLTARGDPCHWAREQRVDSSKTSRNLVLN